MLFLLLSTLIILLSAMITLLWQHRQQTHADSASVVGPPTLPAATVNSILAGTPMAGTGWVIEEASRNTNIDDAFALGVWWSETNDGAAGVGLSYRNPGGVRSSAGYSVGGGGYTIYPSYAAAINDWFNIVESRYINRGLTSVYTICYPYVGTSGATSWANKVYNLMVRYHAMAPAPVPTPTPSPTPSPTPKPRDWEQEQPVTVVSLKHVKQSAPVTTSAKKLVPVATTTSVLSARDQHLVVGIGLLGSAMLVGLGVMVRRRSTQILLSPASPTLPITTALTLESFSERDVSSLSANRAPISAHYASSLRASESEPLQAVPEPATAPLFAISGGGLLTRYRNAEIGPRRIPLETAAVQTEQLSNTNQEKSATSLAFESGDDQGPRTTAELPSIRPSISLPVRQHKAVLELMTTGNAPEEKRKGLLSRYGENNL
jgi:hypothetical protein